MKGLDVLLLGLSAAAQFTAALLAVRIGRRTQQPTPWALIAIAVFLMGVRRSVTLYRVTTDPSIDVDLIAESIALAISLLLLVGLVRIAPHFQAARASSERATTLGQILEESLNEIYLFDAETLRFVQVNRGARQNLGYTMEELAELTPLDLKIEFTPESFDALLAPLRSGEKEKLDFLTVHRRKDGSTYPVEAHIQLGRIGQRRVFSAVIVDQTERRRAEEARRRLEEAAEQAGEGITILDRNGVIEFANAAFAEMMNRPRDAILGSSIASLSAGAGDDALIEDMRGKILAGRTWSGRYESVWEDGTRHVRDATVTPVRNERNAIRGFICVIRDVTREERLQAELRQSQKMEAIGQLAGGVAHDFNNLLTVIDGYAEILLETTEGEAHEAAREIDRATERAAALTHQLLTFARQDRQRPRPLVLDAQIGEMQTLLRRLIGGDVLLEVRLGASRSRVHIDPGQIEQVVMNLAINARDAMPRGGTLRLETASIEVGPDVEAHAGLRPGRYVRLSVSDTGEGMDEEVRLRIFEPFYTTKGVGKGTGLGLSTSYAIVSAAGGLITAESALGQGTTFHIFLPQVEGEVDDAEAPSDRTAASKGRPASILLVEDEPMVRGLTRTFLEAAGHRVSLATDGREALALAERTVEPFDLVMTDVVMPYMSGTELARQLRKRFPGIRVVMISGHAERAGQVDPDLPDAFVPKPFRRDELLRAVDEALAGKGAHGAPETGADPEGR
jgi:PAS domain S-box-containing protein